MCGNCHVKEGPFCCVVEFWCKSQGLMMQRRTLQLTWLRPHMERIMIPNLDVLGGILSKMGPQMFQRRFEEVAENAMLDGIAAGDDDNSLLTRVLMAAVGPKSALVTFARKNRAVGYIPGMVLAPLGAFLASGAGGLFVGDSRPQTRLLRLALKAVGPALAGLGAATDDVIQQQIKSAVDSVVSPSSVAGSDRTASLDLIVIVPTVYGNRPFWPVTSSDGVDADEDSRGIPRVQDGDFLRFAEGWRQSNPTTIHQPKARRGQPQPAAVVSKATPPWKTVTLHEWLSIASDSDVSWTEIEKLKSHFAKPGTGDSLLSDKVWAVFTAMVFTQGDLRDLGQLDWTLRMNIEALVGNMKAEPLRLNRMVGDAFFGLIGMEGALPGRLTLSNLCNVLDSIDIFCGGNDSPVVKVYGAMRQARRLAGPTGWDAATMCKVAFTVAWPIWLPAMTGVSTFVMAVFAFALAVYVPFVNQDGSTHLINVSSGLFDSMNVSARAYSLVVSSMVQWVIFSIARGVLISRAFLGFMERIIPFLGKKNIEGIMRKVTIFGFTLPWFNYFATHLNLFPEFRGMIVLCVGAGVAIAMILVDAKYEYRVEQLALSASKYMSLFMVILPLIYAYTVGAWLGNPARAESITAWVNNVFLASKMLKESVLLLGMLVVGVLVRMIEKGRIVGNAIINDGKVPFARTVMVLALVGGSASIWIHEPKMFDPFDVVEESAQESAPATVPAPAPAPVPAAAPAPAPVRNKSVVVGCDPRTHTWEECNK
jgi:hypothetical protein